MQEILSCGRTINEWIIVVLIRDSWKILLQVKPGARVRARLALHILPQMLGKGLKCGVGNGVFHAAGILRSDHRVNTQTNQ